MLKEKTVLDSPSPLTSACYTAADGYELMTHSARSTDNGRTWTSYVPQPDFDGNLPANYRRGWYPCFRDPVNGNILLVILAMDRPDVDINIEEPAETETDAYVRYRVSVDGGRTFLFDEPVIQQGDYTFKHPLEGLHLGKNAMYLGDRGCTPIRTREGRILVPTQMTVLDAEGKIETFNSGWDYYHSKILIGTWTADNGLTWEVSEEIKADPARTVRGLYEPTLAEMPDGRLLCVMRGSNGLRKDPNYELPGRKWYCVSTDGGYHWTKPEPWRYSNGEDFYSPSSMSQIIQHSNGRYYWLGNINATNPRGNADRYPLVAGEIDPASMMLIKDSIITIDTRGPDDQAEMTLSNFYAFEDRETGDIVLPMAKWSPAKGNQHMLYRIGTDG